MGVGRRGAALVCVLPSPQCTRVPPAKVQTKHTKQRRGLFCEVSGWGAPDGTRSAPIRLIWAPVAQTLTASSRSPSAWWCWTSQQLNWAARMTAWPHSQGHRNMQGARMPACHRAPRPAASSLLHPVPHFTPQLWFQPAHQAQCPQQRRPQHTQRLPPCQALEQYMVDKLRATEATYRELQLRMADPDVSNDRSKSASQEHSTTY